MKAAILLCAVLAAALAAPEGDFYDSKFDDFDVDALLANPRLMKAYANCLLSRAACTSEGASFKKILPEAVATTCGKCTPKQRILVRKVVKAVQQHMPKEWDELVHQYDPDNKYKESFAKFLISSD